MNKQHIPLVTLEQLKTILDYLEELGFDLYPLLESTGLPVASKLMQSEKFVTRKGIHSLMLVISRQLSDEQIDDFVRVVVRRNISKVIKMMDFSGCETLEDALREYCLQGKSIATDLNFLLNDYLGNQWLKCYRKGLDKQLIRLHESYAINVFVELVSQLLNVNWKPKSISLMVNSASHVVDLEAYANPQIYLSRDFTGVEVDDEALKTLIDIERFYPANINLYSSEISFGESLKRALTPFLGEGLLNLNKASDITGISIRTLQRRLSDEGKTFSSVYEEVIIEQAKKSLENSADSITNIAYHLGYASPTHFTRFFKNKTGVSPKTYRKEQQRRV